MAEIVNTRGSSPTWPNGRRILLKAGDSYGFGTETLAANATIGDRSASYLALVPSGAHRDAAFLAAAEDDGAFYVIYNPGPTYNIVVKDSAASTLITLAPGEFVALVYDATAWAVLWRVTASSVPTISPTLIALTDALATALDIAEGGNSYLKFVTSNGAEKVVVGKLLSLLTGLLLADSAASPTVEGQLLYNADHLELHDGTAARSILMSDDIGATVQAYSAMLGWLIATNSVPAQVALTPAAEAGNAIAVAIQIGANSAPVARVQRLRCQLYDADMLPALVAAWTMAETGAGSEVSTTARPALLIDTDGNGAATVTVTDVSGVFAGTMYLEVAPVNAGGTPTIVPLTFA